MTSPSATILYYTNNFIKAELLEASVGRAIRQANANGCELIVISHYPVLKDYKVVPDLYGKWGWGEQRGSLIGLKMDDESERPNGEVIDKLFNKLICKGVRVENGGALNLVVGWQPYHYNTISLQILLGLEWARAERILLWEHDCFYSDGYIQRVLGGLVGQELVWESARLHASSWGFFPCYGVYYLSGISASKTVLRDHFQYAVAGDFKKQHRDEFSLEPCCRIDLETRVEAVRPICLAQMKRLEANGYRLVQRYLELPIVKGEFEILDFCGLNNTYNKLHYNFLYGGEGFAKLAGVKNKDVVWGMAYDYGGLFWDREYLTANEAGLMVNWGVRLFNDKDRAEPFY